MNSTEFMLHLAKQIVAERKVAESSAAAYIRVLYALNERKPFKNLTFLKNTESVDGIITGYADSTQRAILGSVVSVLSLFKDKPTFKKPYTHYYEEMMKRRPAATAEAASNEKTAKQTANWLTWNDVERHARELDEKVKEFGKSKTLTDSQYDTLLQKTILALYTDVQPRRNQDYLDMFIVKKWVETMPADKNYLDIATKQFIFNKYKTAKKYGVQKEAIPERLYDTICVYLRYHPIWKGTAKRKADAVKLLTSAKGEPLTAVNAITRVLNRVFGKKIGSSMLRHIYLSSKYGDTLEEMKKDADAMGHSVAVQHSYVKKEGSGLPTLVITENSQSPPSPHE
jgi:hypothetical protein